ncbi:hypothetical protein GCM10025876_16260 [Demequina litorisediminis]|uniref:Uncharacterized protein n=1 Tax=Demequina litorisediminis TaxID=1849022 RepID=A0ABQ6IFA5_9MICO|nr:hypothetical protein GCM10025876_16260 [Demequina litorisediminis]
MQGHSADDARDRLLDSIEGIEWMIDRWQGIRHARPIPRIATPAWPQPAGAATPYMGTAPLGKHARRALVATGEIAPTLTRVRTSPPVAPPAPLPPRDSSPLPPPPSEEAANTSPATPVPSPPAPRHPERRQPERAAVLGGAFGALAAMRSARSWITVDTPVTGMPLAGMPLAASRIAADFPLAGLHSEPAAPAYAPETPSAAVDESDAAPAPLPLRIAKRDVSADAPDPYTGALHALLTHLERVGFRGAPRSLWLGCRGTSPRRVGRRRAGRPPRCPRVRARPRAHRPLPT